MILSVDSIKDFLHQEFSRRTTFNPKYSQRAFARTLGMSPGELSEVMRGKRTLSLKSCLRIADSLGLNATETKHLVHLSQVQKSQDVSGDNILVRSVQRKEQSALSMDMFHMVSQWYYTAILALFDTLGFRCEVVWIAKRLGLTQSQVKVALERLERLGLVETTDTGEWIAGKEYVVSPDGIPSEAIRNFHRQMLQLSIQALEFQSVKERNVSGAVFAFDPKDLDSIARDVSEFLDNMVAKYSKGKKKEVYFLGSSFFQLTQKRRKGSNEPNK